MSEGSSEKFSEEAKRAPATRDFSHAWRALRHRNFRLFFGGQSISLIGTWMTRIATAWLVYRLTKSALLLGTVSFAGQIPTFLLAPFAGVLVDRLNRRYVLICTQTLAMLQSLALAWLTLTHRINIHDVLALSAFQGVINAFDMPGRQAFMVQMIEDRADLSNAIAINSSMVNLARLIGPSLAGVVIAATNEGWCFFIDGISYIAVIISLLLMRVHVAEVKRATASMFEQMHEGWQYVSTFVPIRNILLLFALVSLMGMPYMVLMPLFAAQVLHGGPHTLGFLMGAAGVGRAHLRAVAGRAQIGARTDQDDPHRCCGLWSGAHPLRAVARSLDFTRTDDGRRLRHDAGIDGEQHHYPDAGPRGQAWSRDELLHCGVRRHGSVR